MSEKACLLGAYARWLTDLFYEIGEDEEMLVTAGDDHVRKLWDEGLSVFEAADDLIDNFSI